MKGNTQPSRAPLLEQLERLRAEKDSLAWEYGLFCAGPVVVFRWRNTEGWPVDFVSPNVNGLFGYSPDDFLSGALAYADLIAESDRTRVAEEVGQAEKQGLNAFDHEPYRIVHKDGTERWLHGHTIALRGADDEIEHYLGYVSDITEQKSAERRKLEEAVARSERKYRQLMEGACEAILVFDADTGIILDANKQATVLLGWSVEQLKGMHQSQLYPDEDAERYRAIFQEPAHQGNGFENATVVRRADGREVPVEIHANAIELDERRVVQGIFRDITERKRNEEELVRANTEWKLTFDTVPDPIAIIDNDYRIVRANRAMVERLGMPLNELLGQTCYSCLHNRGAPMEACPHRHLHEDGRPYSGEVYESNLGSDFLVSVTPLFDTGGTLVGSICMAHDISERKRAEQKRLVLAERQKNTLVREVHHRIKNHLQGIVGLLENGVRDHPEAEIAAPLEAAIQQIKSIARVHGLQARQSGETVDLYALIHSICRSAIEVSGAEIAFYESVVPESTPHLNADEAVPMSLVLNELLQNAVKHRRPSKNGPAVTVELEESAERVLFRIVNSGGPLPHGFDLDRGEGLGTGLGLVKTLLPTKGGRLCIHGDKDSVITELELRAPAIFW